MIQPYCEVEGGKLQAIEDPSLIILGYQSLPLAS